MKYLANFLHNLIMMILWITVPVCLKAADAWRWYGRLPFPKFIGVGVVLMVLFNIVLYFFHLDLIPYLALCAAAGVLLGLPYKPRDEWDR